MVVNVLGFYFDHFVILTKYFLLSTTSMELLNRKFIRIESDIMVTFTSAWSVWFSGAEKENTVRSNTFMCYKKNNTN